VSYRGRVRIFPTIVFFALGTTQNLQVLGAAVPAQCWVVQSGTVYDGRTRLTWQQILDSGTYSQADAAIYCQNLSLNGGGWRVPSRKELETIVDYSRSNPAIDPVVFPNTPAGAFWTSSTVVGTGGGWSVHFGEGSVSPGTSTQKLRVRCVR
jgi:hypothetical protein